MWHSVPMRRTVVGLVLCLLASASAVALPAVSSAQSGCTWQVATTPNPGTKANQFSSVDGAAEDVWAVGARQNRRKPAKTLVEHLTPEGWQVVRSPNQGTGANVLNDVLYLAADDIWAAGASRAGDGARNLLMHYDGASWTLGPKVSSGRALESFAQLAAPPAPEIPDPLTPRVLWAVGGSGNTKGTKARGQVFHFDGTAWAAQEVPEFALNFTLSGVTAISPTDVWAVGGAETSIGSEPVALHYDGSVWSKIPTPNPGEANSGSVLTSVVAASSTDVWAVGVRGGGQPLVMHYDGSEWAVVDTPALEEDLFGFHLSATIDEAGGVWAAGVAARPLAGDPQRAKLRSLVQRGSAEGWTNAPAPNPSFDNALFGIRAVPGGAVWAAGFRAARDRPDKTLLARCG